jgi:hypothetical protein
VQEHYPFVRDDVLPSFWANAIQRFLSTYAALDITKATDNSIEIVGGTDEDASVLGIDGKWRWNEVTVSRAHPGGAAGIYDIFAVTKANDIENAPQPFTDNTVYSYSLRIVPTGTTPPLVRASSTTSARSASWTGTGRRSSPSHSSSGPRRSASARGRRAMSSRRFRRPITRAGCSATGARTCCARATRPRSGRR